MGHARVDDVGRASTVGGPDRRLDLGDHAVADRPCGKQFAATGSVELADQVPAPVTDTFDVGHEDQLAGLERYRKLGGTPVFKGTRVPVKTLFEYLEDNYSLDEFLECFPSVTREMVCRILERSESALIEPVAA